MVEEVLRDFAEISLIETADESDETERLYIEVSEFVRLAWLNIVAEVCGLPETSSNEAGKQETPNTLH